MSKPVIGITMGDPAGIGPEIVVKALNSENVYKTSNPIVIGEENILKQAMEISEIDLEIHQIKNPAQGKFTKGTIDLINIDNINTEELEIGKVQKLAGKAAFEYIEKAVELALKKEIHAIATAPINKESLRSAGIPYIGHTEILENLTNSHNSLTMFQVRNLRVFFLSRHVSLREACDLVTKERVYEFIILCKNALERLGVKNPKIAVAGLNPHCGEHGLFGDEEVKEIQPAVKKAQEKNVNVVGPISADSVFYFALKGNYDAVISLYHDQGHIATKMVDFEKTISLTLNLPFLRTSVDHGTAFDIAGGGKASAVSMIEAIRLAAEYAPYYNTSMDDSTLKPFNHS